MNETDFVEELRKEGKEEIRAYLGYLRLADDAEDLGRYLTADELRMIAGQELEHSKMITRLLVLEPPFAGAPSPEPKATFDHDKVEKKTYQQIAEEQHYGMPQGYMPEGRRPSPKTYGDWVSLAEDIKAKDPDLSYLVNNHLLQISDNTCEAEEAKRWLVSKAGELGIK